MLTNSLVVIKETDAYPLIASATVAFTRTAYLVAASCSCIRRLSILALSPSISRSEIVQALRTNGALLLFYTFDLCGGSSFERDPILLRLRPYGAEVCPKLVKHREMSDCKAIQCCGIVVDS